MKRPMLISQGSLDRMLKVSGEAWQRGDFQECFELLERAIRLNPSNYKILLHLGELYGLRYDYAAAVRCFDRAIRVAPNKAEILAMAGRLSANFRKTEIAGRYFQQAVEQKDALPDTFARLAEFYERLHRPEDAAGMVERALHLNGSCALAWLTRAKLDRQAGQLVEAEQSLRHVLLSTDRDMRVRGYYELGGNLDRQGRYDEAMAAFLEAKEILKPDAAPFAAGLQTIHSRLKFLAESVRPEMFQRWLDFAPNLQPPRRLALLGGHPRSGTTLLEQVLDSHPDVVSAEETEIFHDKAYWPLTRSLPAGNETNVLPVLEAAQTGTLQSARADYFRSMEASLGQPVGSRLLIDKNPSLTFLVPALVRIFPEIKLLIALRDPRDVVLSCFMQPFFQLDQTNSAYLTLEGTAEEYAAVMGVWQAVKPLLKNPWLEARYEDMVDNLESVARKTLNFLAAPWDERVLGFDEHARQKLVRSPTYADVAKPVYRSAMGRSRNYQKYLEPHLKKLEPFVKAFGYE